MIQIVCYLMLQDDEDALLEGEKEAEKMILEAYSALLLAFLSTERSVFFFPCFDAWFSLLAKDNLVRLSVDAYGML